MDALARSGYPAPNLEFTGSSPPRTKRSTRKRKVLWFNPPYSVSVDTNIGHKFLNLLDKHFPKTHKLHKILNRNCVKVSYSCMGNIATIIKSHNKQIMQKHLQSQEEPDPRTCNCRSKEACPLEGSCLSESLVYIRMTEGTFKKRFYNHASSFRLEKYKTSTKLSEKVWLLKEQGLDYDISWRVLRRGKPYINGQKNCDLCTSEKLEILLRAPDPRLLNSRSEILAKCRHKRKFLL